MVGPLLRILLHAPAELGEHQHDHTLPETLAAQIGQELRDGRGDRPQELTMGEFLGCMGIEPVGGAV